MDVTPFVVEENLPTDPTEAVPWVVDIDLEFDIDIDVDPPLAPPGPGPVWRCSRAREADPLVFLTELCGELETGRMYRVPPDGLLLGRSEEADVRLPDDAVSRLHLVLVPTSQGVELVDLGSRSGTYVGGRRVRRHLLVNGGEFVVHGLVFRVTWV